MASSSRIPNRCWWGPMAERTVYVALQQFCAEGDAPRQILEEAGFKVFQNRLGRRPNREDLQRGLEGADAVLAGVEPYDAEMLSELPRLKCISRCGAGTDGIDLEAARRRGVAVLTTPEEVVEPVAQLALGMILALARNIPLHLDDFRRAQWRKRTGHLLSEWTVGLVGYGRIGRRLHGYLRPFGSRVLVCDPNLPAEQSPEDPQRADLKTLLRESDLVSLHAAVPAGSAPLIGRGEIAQMRRGSRLVNTARGRLVDEEALAEALEAGHLSGAALDVFAEEPYGGRLSRMPQVLCTPHIASLTACSRAAMELRCARNVVEFFAKGARRTGVPK